MATALIPEVLTPNGTHPPTGALVKLILSPLRGADGKLHVRDLPVEAGRRLGDVLPEGAWLRLICNGKVLDLATWEDYPLAPGDEVLAIPQWGEPGIVSTLLIYAAVSIAVGLATTALTYLLFPPAKPHVQQGLDEPTFSFEGIRTAVGPGNVVPVVYGRHRVGGQLLSAAVDQAFTVIDGPVGAPPPSIRLVENIVGGRTGEPITVFITNHGGQVGMSVALSGVHGKEGANGFWYITLLDANSFELQSSHGVDDRAYTGGGVAAIGLLGHGTRRVEAQTSPPTLSLLLALAEGPIGGIVFDSIEINGQPIGNFPTVQVFTRIGTPDQAPIVEFGEIANTFPDGREIPGGAGITTTTTDACEAFTLNIAFEQGLFVMTTAGEKQDNVSTFGYRYRVSPAGAWSDYSYYDVSAARTSVVRFAIRKEGLALATYDINLVWSHARNIDDVRAKWIPSLESVTEIRHNTANYAHTALLGLRSIATDQLQGALPNVTVEILGKNCRLNQFDQVLNWTDNPAWCTMDLMTDKRYGLGYDDATINLPAFNAWAQYNDELIAGEKRHTLNYVLDREQRGQPALLEIAGTARALLLKAEGVWTPRVTRDEIPVQLLSWANVSNVKLTYTRDPDRINVMEGRYINEEEGYNSDVLTWPVVANWPPEIRKASLDLRGITKPSRVTRALQFELNRRRFETLSLELDAATDAIVLQIHDIFRFSHPLPGWGESGRLMPGTSFTTLFLDQPVTFVAGKTYHVYVRHDNDVVEMSPVAFPGAGEFDVLDLSNPISASPTPYTSLWAFGESAPVDTAVKLFRVVKLQRKSDTTVHLQAIAHNPSIYDEPTAVPLPNITTLFNPLGPPPPIISLVLTEVTRIQGDGASRRVVNVSWDVAPLSQGYGPYGGVQILRRIVTDSSISGTATAGGVDLGAALTGTDAQVDFVPIMQLRGHILDWDDFTVITGTTYIYRLIPVSQRGVPNNTGGRDGLIHVSGPTTPDFFPGTVQNLRLKGQPVGVTEFEGRDVHLEWEPVVGAVFTETFFVVDYQVDVYAPGQVYLLRHAFVPAGAPGATVNFTYTLEQNIEDQIRAGFGAARRDLLFMVWARTNNNRVSLTPASITVINPPPDMDDIIPDCTPLVGAAVVRWDQWFEPRDFDHYEIHLDTVNPPIAIYTDIGISLTIPGFSTREIAPQGLTIGATYYVYILPYDTFGPGLPSQIASFVPFAIDGSFLDSTPPEVPTGLSLSTGSTINPDGTILPWIEAHWNMGTESDLAGYDVQFRVVPNTNATTFQVGRVNHVRLENVPGNVTIACRIAAKDQLSNISLFTTEVTITTAGDTTPPAVPATPTATGSLRAVVLFWVAPGDADYQATEVWHSLINDLATAAYVGEDLTYFLHEGLATNTTHYYWLRARDTSGNLSAFVPGATAGLSATTVPTSNADIGNLSITETKIADNAISTPKLQANSVDANKVTTGELITLGAQIRTALITDAHIVNLTANKVTAGSFNAVYSIGVGTAFTIDGPNRLLTVFDFQTPPVPRVYLGKCGDFSDAYGLQIFNAAGQLMWNFLDGVQNPGIAERVITGNKIAVGAITAELLIADTAVITNVAQIQTALIVNAHIANGNITAAKIADANILRAHIQDLAVNSAKIEELVADKITTGTLTANYRIGVGNFITLDGPNHLITIRDAANAVRVFLGNVGGFYGLQVLNGAGAIMWDFTDGASTIGIKPNAVSNAVKVTGVSLATSSGAEEFIGAITFPTVVTGDVVGLWMTGIAQSGDTCSVTIRIREDSMSGNVVNSTAQAMPSAAENIAVNGIHVVSGGTFTSKQYWVTGQRTTSPGTVNISDVVFFGIRFQR